MPHWINLLLKLTLLLTAAWLFMYYILVPALLLIYLDQIVQALAGLLLFFFGA